MVSLASWLRSRDTAIMYELVSDEAGLSSCIAALEQATLIGFDTEFVREGRYLPEVALLGFYAGEKAYLVDPLKVKIAPLKQIFAGDATIIMHSGSQDLEILQLEFGVTPKNYFDTQIAAAFLGLGMPGFGKLVRGVLREEVPKSSTLHDWLRRPLDEKALRYAAGDVRYLLPLFNELSRRLEKNKRVDWAEEEFRKSAQKERAFRDPQKAWWKVKARRKWSLGAQLVAQEVCAFRENVALSKNRPPSSIMSDLSIQAIVERKPSSLAELSRIRGLSKSFADSSLGEGVLAALQRARALEAKDLIEAENPQYEGASEGLIVLALGWAKQVAKNLGVETALLATRKDVEAFLSKQPSRLDEGWRNEALGAQLDAIASGKSALRYSQGKLSLLPVLEAIS